MRYISILIFALLFAGCAFKNPDHKEATKSIEKTAFEIPKEWSITKDNGATNLNWVKSFNDETLNQLVQEALKNNQQLKTYQAQVEQANAFVNLAASALKPTVGLNGTYNSRNVKGLTEIHGGGLTANWELDVWGRIDLSIRSAKESALATQSDYEFARQSLMASTAKAWFMINSSYLQMQNAQSIITILEKELGIAQTKYKVGQISQQEVLVLKSNLAKAENAYAKANTAYKNAQRSLEVILGRYPKGLIEHHNTLTSLPSNFPDNGLPSQLLERRPDLIAAEQRVAAAFYKQREAELLHLPEVTLSIGAVINNISDATTDLIAGLFVPLYTGGAIEAEVENATAVQKQRIAQYGQVALNAFEEVENNLLLEQRLLEQHGYLENVVKNSEKKLELSKISHSIGKVEYYDVLVQKNNLIVSKISLLDIQTQQLLNRVNLYLSLGGDFK